MRPSPSRSPALQGQQQIAQLITANTGIAGIASAGRPLVGLLAFYQANYDRQRAIRDQHRRQMVLAAGVQAARGDGPVRDEDEDFDDIARDEF